MKKLIALTLILISIFTLASCSIFGGSSDNNGGGSSNNGGSDDKGEKRVKIRVGYLTGPTGMGMAKLIVDNNGIDGGNENYEFTKYADSNAAKADLAAGKIDVICLPTNEAAMYQSKVDADAKLLAVNCLNSLFVISTGTPPATLYDFEGKTIYTCKNGTPRIVLEYIIKELGINAEVSYTVDGKEMVTPNDVSAQIMASNIPNAVLPEPLVSTIEMKTLTSAQLRPLYFKSIDLSNEWARINDTPITMGCIISSGKFVKENKYTLDLFLDEYKASVEYIANPDNFDSAADYVYNTGIIPFVPQARAALMSLKDSLVFLDGEEMKTSLVAFYQAIGVALPDDSFYYEK